MKKYRVKLSSSEISKLISELEEYKADLNRKAERLAERISEELRDDINAGFAQAQYDDVLGRGYVSPKVSVYIQKQGNTRIVFANGPEAVFVEFGAGVTHNAGDAPHASDMDPAMSIGSYGYHQGLKPKWYFTDEQGIRQLSYGTPAQMPMYKAMMRIESRLVSIAREVFND